MTTEKIAVNVTRKSPFSGDVNTITIHVTREELARYSAGEVIQNAFPNLSADEREFILTGITPTEWADSFPEE